MIINDIEFRDAVYCFRMVKYEFFVGNFLKGADVNSRTRW